MGAAVTLAHGGGGSLMAELLAEAIWPWLAVEERGEDAAWAESVLVSTDSFVVQPLFFPGGDIGKLAVYGTVNDLAMRAGRPVAMTVSLIVEEGLPLEVLERVVRSLGEAAARCSVAIVGGDLKVVETGRADGLYINTTGLARPLMGREQAPSLTRARPGDAVLINGPLGEHGIAVLAAREQLDFAAAVASDCTPLHELVEALVSELGPRVHCLHDPTRGGLAAALNELARAAGVGVVVEEAALPRNPAVEAACELLGFDALEVANEGKLVAVVAPEAAEGALEIMTRSPVGRQAAIIGQVTDGLDGRVILHTELGTQRIVAMPSGELLPRIC
jgi:hydrogenase expression/formation protein HypE